MRPVVHNVNKVKKEQVSTTHAQEKTWYFSGTSSLPSAPFKQASLRRISLVSWSKARACFLSARRARGLTETLATLEHVRVSLTTKLAHNKAYSQTRDRPCNWSQCALHPPFVSSPSPSVSVSLSFCFFHSDSILLVPPNCQATSLDTLCPIFVLQSNYEKLRGRNVTLNASIQGTKQFCLNSEYENVNSLLSLQLPRLKDL